MSAGRLSGRERDGGAPEEPEEEGVLGNALGADKENVLKIQRLPTYYFKTYNIKLVLLNACA